MTMLPALGVTVSVTSVPRSTNLAVAAPHAGSIRDSGSLICTPSKSVRDLPMDRVVVDWSRAYGSGRFVVGVEGDTKQSLG